MDVFDSVYSNNILALREYLETGNVNIVNERGMSLLHYSIVFNNMTVFNILLDNYIDINIKDNHGDTAAHICVINNRIGFLKALIRNNCDLTIRNNDGHTPLFKACSLGRENMVELFLETLRFNLYETDSKDETIFMALIRSRNMDLLNRIKLDDKIVNKPNYMGETALHIASKTGDLMVINYLLKNKAFVNAKNKTGETPIFYAVQAQNKDVISILLKNGALLDCKSTFGDTVYNLIPTYDLSSYINDKSEQYKTYLYHSRYPLHHAIIVENVEMVKRFSVIRNLEHKDDFGYTPLELAKLINNEKIIKILNENL